MISQYTGFLGEHPYCIYEEENILTGWFLDIKGIIAQGESKEEVLKDLEYLLKIKIEVEQKRSEDAKETTDRVE